MPTFSASAPVVRLARSVVKEVLRVPAIAFFGTQLLLLDHVQPLLFGTLIPLFQEERLAEETVLRQLERLARHLARVISILESN